MPSTGRPLEEEEDISGVTFFPSHISNSIITAKEI
jgi:hypothetical protein